MDSTGALALKDVPGSLLVTAEAISVSSLAAFTRS